MDNPGPQNKMTKTKTKGPASSKLSDGLQDGHRHESFALCPSLAFWRQGFIYPCLASNWLRSWARLWSPAFPCLQLPSAGVTSVRLMSGLCPLFWWSPYFTNLKLKLKVMNGVKRDSPKRPRLGSMVECCFACVRLLGLVPSAEENKQASKHPRHDLKSPMTGFTPEVRAWKRSHISLAGPFCHTHLFDRPILWFL